MPTAAQLPKKLLRPLVAWYRREKRRLPWRSTRDPYKILVSEFMLQQTQVSTVIPYYERFITAFPTLSDLRRAPRREVLKMWEGLGYYTRARNLHRTAREIMARYGGKIPSRPEELASLPGIGRYTAGAIASIAYDVKAPVLDGNVRRVLCRLLGVRRDPRRSGVQNLLWTAAARVLPDRNVGEANQAFMELGAIVCIPRIPICPACPVRKFCRAYRMNLQTAIPLRVVSPRIPSFQTGVALIRNGNHWLMGPRPEEGLLGGLWGFPELDWTHGEGPETAEELFERQIGFRPVRPIPLPPVVHTFSHKRVTYHPSLYLCPTVKPIPLRPWRWIAAKRLTAYPLPNAMRKMIDAVRPEGSLPLAAETEAVYRRGRPARQASIPFTVEGKTRPPIR